MAYKFLVNDDFTYKIRHEIFDIIKGTAPDNVVSPETAENVALAQIKQYIGHRYDTVAIFAATGADRDAYIIDVVITIMLYKMYSGKTGMKDIPTTRKEEYDDVMKWLDKVGDGRMNAMLPTLITDEAPGDVRINSMEQKDWEY